MKVLSLIFHLGVLFSAFAFIWFWFQLLLLLLLPKSIRTQIRYFLHLMQSLFLGVLVLKFVEKEEGALAFSGMLILSLFTYFLYLLRNLRSAKKAIRLQVYSNLHKNLAMKNEWEWAVAFISLGVTVLWVFYPIALNSVATQWYYELAHDLITVPFIGWIFKIAGFFFVIATFFRFTGGLISLFSKRKAASSTQDSDEFDSYEEIK
jgi:hypothetical protein